jgi:aconitate hydratase A / 2-methylisocitrate dehydratase
VTKPRPAHLTGTQRNTLRSQRDLVVDGQRLRYHDINSTAPPTLPVSLRILLENVLRFHDGTARGDDQIKAIIEEPDTPVDLYPSRVFLHDTNGVPTLVDHPGRDGGPGR